MNEHAAASDIEELQLLRDGGARFAEQHTGTARLRSRRDSGVEYDRAVWQKMGEDGYLAVAIPTEYDGLQLPLDHRAALAEEFGRHLIPEPYLSSALFAVSLIASGDNAGLKQRLLPSMALGQIVAAVAWEERLGSIVDESVATLAVRSGRATVLRGKKRFIRPGSLCDGLIVSAATPEGVGLYWVASDAPGVSFNMQRLADGGSVADVILDDVAITPESTLRSAVDGAAILATAIDSTLVMASAELLGIVRRSLEMTLDYLRVRVQFGKPIGSFQALQHRAVNLYIQQQLAEVAIGDALDAFRKGSDPLDCRLKASRAKARCSEAALLVTREAVQMFGAIGFTDDHDIGLYLKRALVQSAWLGNASQHRRRYVGLGHADPRRFDRSPRSEAAA